jgi:hypothetical protein
MVLDVSLRQIREPRCRIWHDPELQVLVDSLLDWCGVSLPAGGGSTRRITYADVIGDLEPINRRRAEKDLNRWIDRDLARAFRR